MSKSPKPSVLLVRALKLFGPKGENWIQGEENVSFEGGFIIRDERRELSDALGDLSHDIDRASTPKAALKVLREFQSQAKPAPAVEEYCSIGAVHKVNTPNAAKAAVYLARAINQKKYNNMTLRRGYASYDAVHNIITNSNDAEKVKFPQVRAWFKRAIKLAISEGM